MCFFPSPNVNFNSLAYKKGVLSFDCGACPECLRKRANVWALRAVYESKLHVFNCMVTLTYDSYLRDEHGNVIGEKDPDPDLHVNVRDVQLFLKRLRKWQSSFTNEKIKYIACAEYGSRTHRAHYHLLLFGVRFPDLCFLKKSKRGNVIQSSAILTRLWNKGICTVDSSFVTSACARYCTKYCAKSRSDDTFMLCSQKIGYESLMRDFNGKSYFVEGREYPVPRFVWQDYIVGKYQKRYSCLKNVPLLSPRYVNRNRSLSDFDYDYHFEISKKQRAFYRTVRDRDPLYIAYLDYWRHKGLQFEQNLLPVRKRILLLDSSKFAHYRIAALKCYDKRKKDMIPYMAPGSFCKSAYEHWRLKMRLDTCPTSLSI